MTLKGQGAFKNSGNKRRPACEAQSFRGMMIDEKVVRVLAHGDPLKSLQDGFGQKSTTI